MWRIWSWCGSTSFDFNVFDNDLWLILAFSMAASVFIKPFHGVPISTPAAYSNGHTIFEIILVLISVATISTVTFASTHLLRFATLSESLGVGTISGPLKFHMEFFSGIDGFSWSVTNSTLSFDSAITTSVAVRVVTFFIWSVTLMWGSVPSVGIGLHDIPLWAPVASNHVGITVVVTTTAFDHISIPVFGWHGDQIESGIATASRL